MRNIFIGSFSDASSYRGGGRKEGLRPIGHYIDDREEMIEQVKCSNDFQHLEKNNSPFYNLGFLCDPWCQAPRDDDLGPARPRPRRPQGALLGGAGGDVQEEDQVHTQR